MIEYFWEYDYKFGEFLKKYFPKTYQRKYSMTGNGIYNLIIVNDKVYEVKFSEAKTLLEDNTLDKVYQNQINNITNDNDEIITDSSLYDKRLKDAYEFITLATKALIETSPDGIIITPESREQAKELVKKQF